MSFSQIMSKYPRSGPKVELVKTNNSKNDNSYEYKNKITKSDFEKITDTNDYYSLLKNCIYIPNFICNKDDFTLFYKILEEVKDNLLDIRHQHNIIENPEISPTFNFVVDKMAKHFNIDVMQTRLNYYKTNENWKKLHHDKHCYQGRLENFTCGISLGESRKILFKHDKTNKKFYFDQHNGDLFAFDDVVNREFKHGIPKSTKCGTSPDYKGRISIIIWGVK